jgi:hypothetical protein
MGVEIIAVAFIKLPLSIKYVAIKVPEFPLSIRFVIFSLSFIPSTVLSDLNTPIMTHLNMPLSFINIPFLNIFSFRNSSGGSPNYHKNDRNLGFIYLRAALSSYYLERFIVSSMILMIIIGLSLIR